MGETTMQEIFTTVLPYVIAAASAIAAITPTKRDNVVLWWLKRLANVLALNVGHAKPGDPDHPTPKHPHNQGPPDSERRDPSNGER